MTARTCLNCTHWHKPTNQDKKGICQGIRCGNESFVAVKELRPVGEKQPREAPKSDEVVKQHNQTPESPKNQTKTTSLEYWGDEATKLPVDVKDFEIWTASEFGCNLFQSDKDLTDELSY